MQSMSSNGHHFDWLWTKVAKIHYLGLPPRYDDDDEDDDDDDDYNLAVILNSLFSQLLFIIDRNNVRVSSYFACTKLFNAN